MKVVLFAILVVLLAVSSAVGYQFAVSSDARRASRAQTCDAFEGYNRGLSKLIRDGEKVLPTLSYYRHHPDELRRAIASDEHAIRVLSANLPTYCLRRKP